jgi:hypothetical protein
MASRRQAGQALVLTLAFVASVMLAWILVFNVGQTVNAKLRLNAAADAAAYSAAAWEARSLNYQAYLNRAIVANEVAIAQLVSLRSWSAYLAQLLKNVSLVSNIIPPLGRVMHVIERAWSAVDRGVQRAAPPLENGISRLDVDVLLRAQAFAQQQAAVGAADLVERVARDNLPDARVSRATAALQVRNARELGDLSQIRRHGDRELRPYIALLEDSRDGFTARRNHDLAPANPLATVPKRGGTDLIGEYAWRGADTMASHVDAVLADFELPIGWGAGETRHHAQTAQGTHGGSRRANPRTTRLALAASNVRNGYGGVPEFRDVRGTPTEAQATVDYVVVLELPRSSVGLADRVLGTTGIVDAADERHDVGAATDNPLLAMGAAKVHFHRPEPRSDGRVEHPSLFNPYWEARLAPRPAGGLRVVAGIPGAAR